MDNGQISFAENLDISLIDGEAGVEIEGASAPYASSSAAEQWRTALERVVPAVVVLKVTQTRAFDTELAGSSYATGFVVDKTLGLILTNRHVVTPGPIVAEAVFQNREEVPVHPVYYDPIHDFGFLRYDPRHLQFMVPTEIPLAPSAAAVGLEVRVVGNDSGEKISILSGTLARLDRDAPYYGRRAYNDFNSFYLQAASGTKGGSSGSPVIDIFGRAVALNAGGKSKAASAYYLPLERVVRAVEILRSCAFNADKDNTGDVSNPVKWQVPVVSRGDLQTTFLFKGFDELKRLGLRGETEAQARATQADIGGIASGALAARSAGMLVVDSVVPGGPADGILEPGDVLVRLCGDFVWDFQRMEELLDDAVATASVGPGSARVLIEVERGGKPLSESVRVQDLHAVTPSEFVEVGGGTVHSLSYQQARTCRAEVGQVYVADPGYLLSKAGLPRNAIITAISSTSTPDLSSFMSALLALRHGQRVPVEYLTFEERFRRKQVILHVDFNWCGPPVRWVRDDAEGVWQSTTLLPAGYLQTREEETGKDEEGHNASPNRITSPHIQGTCAKRPPLPPAAKVVSPALALPTLVAPEPLGIPRRHSVADVAASTELEKTQAGITARGDDTRLRSINGMVIPEEPEKFEREGWRKALEDRLRGAMVTVDVEIPLVALADGVHSRAFSGCGIIVHLTERVGLVLVDHNTVSIGAGDVMLSFGGYPAELPARVRFIHPLHNFSIVSFDPSELTEEARSLTAAVTLAPDPPLRRGDSVELVCLSKSLRILHRTSLVTNPTMPVIVSQAAVPRFRAVMEEAIKIDQDFGISYSGVLADRSGAVRALWGSYSEQIEKQDSEWTAGLATRAFLPWVTALVSSLDPETRPFVAPQRKALIAPPPRVRVLDAELEPLLLSKASQFGLTSEWVSKLVVLDPERRQVLRVCSTVAGSSAKEVLKDGDMVLAIGGQPVSAFSDVEAVIEGWGSDNSSVRPHAEEEQRKRKRVRASEEKPPKENTKNEPSENLPPLPLTIFRGNEGVIDVKVRLGFEDGLGTDRLVHWCGAQLQAPHRAVRELGFLPPDAPGVYISRWHHGSPAHRFGLYALHWIVEVNGKLTPTLDDFLAVVVPLENGADVRVKLVHFETTRLKVLTLKTDLRYWPTWELRLDAATGEWSRVQVQSLKDAGS